MKKRFRSPAVLLVAFAMVVVTAGVVYAHWTSTSRIEANINTGNMQIGWNAWGTNDDGQLDNDPSGNDDQAVGEWSSNDGSSMDPRDPDDPALRHTKNAANCWVDGGEDTLFLGINSGYPSYYCHLFAEASNHGTVPVKATALRLSAEMGTQDCTLHQNADFGDPDMSPFMKWDEGVGMEYVDFNNNDAFDGVTEFHVVENDGPWNFEADVPLFHDCVWNGFGMTMTPTGPEGEFLFNDDIRLHIEEGILCGTQVDPGGEFGEAVAGWIHVENGAQQNYEYRITLEQDWINWNEWDASMCTFNGVLLP
jgi:hypothetical protein